ncbi:multiple monosaccharide ABC transporter permease [Mycolicibacterium diernhoferi]|uniref:Xylose transport system permease protein XylH n=1 Tax=Mycolicibacterium diernhoferi TaxID=1801 RepID=A0A1Q4HA87_9MYCO|nr:multiple monosaccharide ABC transporter permease [Mycolicibacterium diernhoferi]OJZ64454.1 sugar ABC transporter permease [Mycolicibacterium diernhoferi]OPE54893.1 sugar ABC transporter permease [Mycolicibacterium diernhoferi]PEG52323.1 sugar ABC transporter permease [Mycolicibacterium diernhoferi]QYL24279.1 sugar ABC transporter permease [Mycolicibacterium diernhoferi]
MTTSSTVDAASNTPAPPPESGATRLLTAIRGNFRQYGMVVALILIVILFQIWTSGILLKPLNVTNIVQQNGYILILAIGMVIVIISGHIDLSVGSIAGFIGAMSAVLMIRQDMPWPVAVSLCLLLGALIGAWQGFWIAYVGIPSFIVTLAGMLVFRGATQYLLEGQSIAPFPRSFSQVSSGFLPEVGGNALYHWPTLILGALVMLAAVCQQVRQRNAQTRYGFEVLPLQWFIFKCAATVAALAAFTLLLASYRGVPVVGIILAVAFVVYAFLMRSSVFGRQVYAVGGNVAAARLSGVKTKRVTFLVFVNMGLLSALAGLLFAARLNSATPQAGIGMELEAIAAAFIGGASANGGVGTVFGAIIGGFVLGVLNNGMSLVGIGSDVQQVIKGLVLLAAVGFDVYNKKKSGA